MPDTPSTHTAAAHANTATIGGRLDGDPVIRHSSDGRIVVEVWVEVDGDGDRVPDPHSGTGRSAEGGGRFRVLCHGILAENVALSLVADDAVRVTGRLVANAAGVAVLASDVAVSVRECTVEVSRGQRRRGAA